MLGHTFVVHSKMESVAWDAAIIPTDAAFTVEGHWSAVLEARARDLRPEGWGDAPFAQARTNPALYFLDVTAGAGLQDLFTNLATLLTTIESDLRERAAAGKSALWRIALPVLGIGKGGLQASSGAVVDGLLRTTQQFSSGSSNCDVVIVCARRSAYAAFQARRRDQANSWPEGIKLESARSLGVRAQGGSLALLLGAGVSVPAGLPSWNQLLERARGEDLELSEQIADFASLSVLDQAELLQRRLKGKLSESIAAQVAKMTKPALGHTILATLGCREIITTNYDQGFEKAVNAQEDNAVSRLPWEPAAPGRPWILKLHGDAEHPGSIVLTRGQFVQYDAAWRPAGSLFQSVLLTKHLLVVGASLTDDNILRLTHEAKRFREMSNAKGTFGTVLSMRPEPLKAMLWENELEWIGAAGESIAEQGRNIEIFLDALGAFASADASYLLDPDFQDLLDEPQRAVAGGLRDLASRMEGFGGDHGGAWRQLARSIRSFGARPD